MRIYSVYDEEFKAYGRIVEGCDTKELQKVLETTPLPEGTQYVAEEPILQNLAVTKDFEDRLFGGQPVQMGWVNGHNTMLNCLEYHRDSEFNIGSRDFILLVGLRSQIGEDWMFDTKDTMAFRCPAGVLIEVYATTLHYTPCSSDIEKGFKVLVALPKGTNTEKPEFTPQCHEDTLMTARNKWLLPHSESRRGKAGAVIGLKGENINIEADLK